MFKPSATPNQREQETINHVIRLFKQVFVEPPWKMDRLASDATIRAHLARVFEHPHGICLVVHYNGRVVGFAMGLPLNAMPANAPSIGATSIVANRKAKEYYLLSHVGMDFSHRRVGIPKLLSRIRQNFARRMGYSRAFVAIHPKAKPGFVNTYLKDGFQLAYSRTYKTRPDEPDHPNLYEKALLQVRSGIWKDPDGQWYAPPAPTSDW